MGVSNLRAISYASLYSNGILKVIFLFVKKKEYYFQAKELCQNKKGERRQWFHTHTVPTPATISIQPSPKMVTRIRDAPPPTASSDAPPAETLADAPRRRGGAGGGVKRKASSNLSSSSSAPSKRPIKEQNVLNIPSLHNGPLTRARQSPGKLAGAYRAAVEAAPATSAAGGGGGAVG